MSNSTAQVLMKKGKRGAAAYIHDDCSNGSPKHLGPLLDVLLNPSKAIDEWETIDWCRWLIAGGRTPDEFAAIVRSYDNHDKCGLVWIPFVVAYRCRTCGISPCMSICRDCFHRGDHSTHDFNMFLSQAGGACDCGDISVMKEDGFCSNHGNRSCHRPSSAPSDLMCVAEAMMPRVILRLLQHFRENSWGTEPSSDTYRIAVQECEGYISMLMDFHNMGDLMRKAMTKALTNPQVYRYLVEPPFAETEYGQYMIESNKMYERAVASFPASEPPKEFMDIPSLAQKLHHNSLLEELIFWTFKYEFPQNVVCFLLNLLPDQDFKEHLTRTFVLHYARIPQVLEASADPEKLSNRVVHMSVQLFSNQALALRCVQNLKLLHVMVLSLKLMMVKILVQNTLHDRSRNFHFVINCTRRVMKDHCYWPLVSDFNNVLSHASVAHVFLQDDVLIHLWFEFLSLLQGMNVNLRETGAHVEYETSSYYAAFSCELEAAAYPMWSIISHLKGPEHAHLAKKMVKTALSYLQDWLNAVDFREHRIRPSEMMRASFHFPLHRYLAAFLCVSVRCIGLQADELLPSTDTLALLMHHPLRVQALFYEILGGKWVRNGLQIKGQAMTYIQANFCNSMVDMDVFFLQVCAALIPPDQYIDTCIDMFGVREWLSLAPLSSSQLKEQDSMVEGLLMFLAILISSRTNLGNDEMTQSRLEISTLLATGDKTHSQLLELMPERSGNAHTRNFEAVLKELSTYRAPGRGSENLEQGLFVPKPEVWEKHYDPLHVLTRAVHRRDFQASMERFTTYVREKEKASGVSGRSGNLWPPLRRVTRPPPPFDKLDPRRICTSGVLCGALMAVLHRAVHRRQRAAPNHAPPDHVMALALHLLDLAADLAIEQKESQPDPDQSTVCVNSTNCGEEIPVGGRPLLEVFGERLVHNVRRVVASVTVPQPPNEPNQPPAAHLWHNDSDAEWDGDRQDVGDTDLDADDDIPESEPDSNWVMMSERALAVPPPMHLARPDSIDSDVQNTEITEATDDDPYYMELRPATPLALPESPAGTLAVMHSTEMAVATTSNDEWSTNASTSGMSVENSATGSETPSDERPPYCENGQVPVRESILSLLLKLHSQLSGRLDSFSLEEFEASEQDGSIIGDGPRCVGNVLKKLCSLDARVAATIRRLRARLWPNQRERHADMKAREKREKEERSRRAKERQQKMMQEFAKKQEQFLNAMKAMESEENVIMDWQEEEEPIKEMEYDCVICNTTGPTTHANPVGLVVLLQSTSVLGHRISASSPSSSEGKLNLGIPTTTLSVPGVPGLNLGVQTESRAAAVHERCHEELAQHFPNDHLLAMAPADEGCVHAQSCGHHLHVACLRDYLRALAAPSRPHNLLVERGEFFCPVCRQLANSVLPLSPGSAPSKNTSTDMDSLANDIDRMLLNITPPPAATNLSEAMGKAMEDMTSTASSKLKQRLGTSHAAIFAFVACLARTNVECEIVQRGGSLVTPDVPPRYRPRRDCLVPLLQVVSAHARALVSGSCSGAGARLSASVAASFRALCATNSDVVDMSGSGAGQSATPPVIAQASPPSAPLLLRDPSHLLLQLLLLTLHAVDMPYFTCMVRLIYRLTYYQIVAQLAAGMNAAGRAHLTAPELPNEPPGIRIAARILLGALAGSELFTEDGSVADASPALNKPTDIHCLEKQLQELSLPFLRVAALLRHHLFGEELPEITSPQAEFVRLVYYLELVTEDESARSVVDMVDGSMEWGSFSAWAAVWGGVDGIASICGGRWASSLGGAAARCQLGVRRLLRAQHCLWLQPALLPLPRDYDKLFTYYHERVCSQCGAVPKEASVCLLCGTLVCLKQQCCRQQEVCEAVQHAMECGGGTGIFLVVTSTYIIVIRGRRACLWGSLYLDDYDEEDRDLKRGKPLYLSQDRFELLESQWLAHRFDHTKRTWVWHRDSL